MNTTELQQRLNEPIECPNCNHKHHDQTSQEATQTIQQLQNTITTLAQNWQNQTPKNIRHIHDTLTNWTTQ
jgi:transcription elongation factor Elf1